jgi:hypothetical protein
VGLIRNLWGVLERNGKRVAPEELFKENKQKSLTLFVNPPMQRQTRGWKSIGFVDRVKSDNKNHACA